MKTLSFPPAAILFLTLGCLPCRAQTPQGPPTGPTPVPAASPIPNGPTLQTRIFEIRDDFFACEASPEGNSSSADPFAPDAPKPRILTRIDYKSALMRLGIEFSAPGSTVSHGPGRWEITLTNTPEQLDNFESVLTPMGTGPPRQGQVHLEVFSMPPLTARKALLAHPKERALHAWLDAELAKPDPTVKLERHTITMVRAGQKSKTEGINEIPSPTEFNGPQIPQTITVPAAAPGTSTPDGKATFAPWPRTEPQPSSFKIRHTGNTFEVELTFGDDGQSVDLNLAPRTSRRVGIAKFGQLEDVQQPIFETQNCAVQASGLIGQPILISSFSPPVNTGVPGGNQVDRTWLLFVTVKEPE